MLNLCRGHSISLIKGHSFTMLKQLFFLYAIAFTFARGVCDFEVRVDDAVHATQEIIEATEKITWEELRDNFSEINQQITRHLYTMEVLIDDLGLYVETGDLPTRCESIVVSSSEGIVLEAGKLENPVYSEVDDLFLLDDSFSLSPAALSKGGDHPFPHNLSIQFDHSIFERDGQAFHPDSLLLMPDSRTERYHECFSHYLSLQGSLKKLMEAFGALLFKAAYSNVQSPIFVNMFQQYQLSINFLINTLTRVLTQEGSQP